MNEIKDNLVKDLEEAVKKAWDSLSRYKFNMFGYWAAIWVHLNRVSGLNNPNPFKDAVLLAKGKVDERTV